MGKKKLNISFSGGRTSAVMTKLLLEQYSDQYEFLVVFANTGCEHSATLDFVRDCDLHFGFNTVWVEAVFGPSGVGVRHKIVDYKSAARNGEPFREFIKKHGISNMANPSCTGRLKADAIDSYRREAGFLSAKIAIGIRADELDRVSASAEKRGFIYPLVQKNVTKKDVVLECEKWPFKLKIPGDHFGNCVWCWKKSLRKLATVAKQCPSAFDFPLEMDRLYSGHKLSPATTSPQGDRRAFRGHKNTQDILDFAANGDFEEYSDSKVYHDPLFDWGAGCGESCEIGSDDNAPRPLE